MALVALLADDVLGATREQAAEGVSESYRSAFAEIDTDPNQFLCVVEEGGRVVGVVSHVAEMRDRIPVQLHVTKGRNGSSVRLSRGV